MTYWDERIGDGGVEWFHREMAERVLAHLDGGVACDVGCGLGQVAGLIVPWAYKVVGCDSSIKRLDAAARHPRISYSHCQAEGLPLHPESADVVFALQVMQHLSIESQRKFASEALRVLKPGGVWLWQTVETYPGYEPTPRHIAHTEKDARALACAFSSVEIERQLVPDSTYTWLWVKAVKA